MKKLFTLFFALVASAGIMIARSFVGFEASTSNRLGDQIYNDNLIQNKVNVTIVEVDADKHKYNINLINSGEGTFTMGGVTFSFTHEEAGKTAYKTYDTYIQPNGINREITIPTMNGEIVKVVLVEDCAGILVNGVSTDFVAGDNVLTATGSSIVLKNSNAKPKISAILSLSILGTCGENLTWDLIDGVLTISGYGDMTNWSTSSDVPWYSYRKNIKSVIIGNRVTSIGNSAFSGCSGLTSVTIPNSVTCIGHASFYGCSSLTSVTIPNSVTSIGDQAFYYCSGLTSVTIPNSVKSIGNYAFINCYSLTSVTIPNSVTSIGRNAFFGCSGLTSPVYNAHVFAYLPTSYSGSYVIPNDVEQIAGEAFFCCSSLTSIEIPNSVTNIGPGAFFGCTSLTTITIPNSVDTIGFQAFFQCSSLISVTCERREPPVLTYFEREGSNFYLIFGEIDGEYATTPPSMRIYVPCGSLDSYKNTIGWSDYASKIVYPSYPNYIIEKKAKNGNINTTSTDTFTVCDESHPVFITATPNRGYQFLQWSDGVTDNPRTIELTQDTTMEAIFDYMLEGKCGKDSMLVWKLDTTTMALEITGKGALSENYTYGAFIESLTIGNEVATIGQSAFYGCNNLKNVILGSSVKVLEECAFCDCPAIETITCYSQRPPTVNNYALYGLDYSTIVYVPADYLNTYKMHDAWGLYDVRPLGATSAETDDIKITPSETTAEVVWPAVSGAATYELVIRDKAGNIICTLVFNANGQLTTIAFNAPARNNAPQQTQSTGFSFTVTGLEKGTIYDLTMTAKDSNGTTLDSNTIAFTTAGGEQAIDQIDSSSLQGGDRGGFIFRDGQLFILRGDRTYTITGQEIK